MKLKNLVAFLLAASFGVALANRHSDAQTTYTETVAVFRGSDINIRSITLSSNTATALWSANAKRPDSICFNNSANTVWVGTTSATMDNVEHSNIANGFPLLSSATFALNGAMSGTAYGTAGNGIASSNIRCLDGITR